MSCPSCGTENELGRKFCAECGAKLVLACAACGASNTPGAKFCGECGTALIAAATAAPTTPDAERRLVSVLFADLVGFTTLSEGRDAEEVRDLLSRYFDTARRVIGRYGGTVEKFIGDAVMAVWGAPIAQEDDAERAVRTALDLVGEVTALGAESGAPGSPAARRCRHRGSGSHHRRRGSGDGRRRPRQHRIPRAIRGRPGHRARWRRDGEADRLRHRV